MAGVGLGSTATRFVAQFSFSDQARAGRIIALVTASSVITVFAASVVLSALSGVLATVLMDAPHLKTAILWAVLVMAATAFRTIQSHVFSGLERFDLVAQLNILEGLVTLPAIMIMTKMCGLQGALIGLAISAIVVWSVGCLLLGTVLRSRGIIVHYRGCWEDWRILPSYSFPRFLTSSLSTPIIWLAMLLVARSDDGFAQLGIYNAAYQWVGPLIFLPMVLSNVSIPALVQEWEAGRADSFRRVFLGLVALGAALTLSISFVIALLSPWIMALYGPGFQDGWSLLVILVLASAFLGIGNISSNALFGMNRPWSDFILMVIWSIVLLAITAGLLNRMGVYALAAGFLISHFVRAGLASVMVLKHTFGKNSK
jgi:O-antigen/teichoic acid export membrane protein